MKIGNVVVPAIIRKYRHPNIETPQRIGRSKLKADRAVVSMQSRYKRKSKLTKQCRGPNKFSIVLEHVYSMKDQIQRT